MHHVIVTRVSATLCLLLAGCILGFAMLVDRGPSAGQVDAVEGRPPEAAAGAMHFEAHCARCHGVDELTGPLRAAPDRDALLDEWVRFLEEHGRASGEQDRAILVYLDRRAG